MSLVTTRPQLYFDSPRRVEPFMAQLGFRRARFVYHHNIDDHVPDPGFDGLVVLDREDLFDDYDHKHFDAEAAKAAIGAMLESIARVRNMYPKAKVAAYNVPFLHYWFSWPFGGPAITWKNAAPEQREAVMQWYADANRPLVEALDALVASIYDPYDAPHTVAADLDYMRARVELCRRMAGDRPVLPCTWPVNLNAAPTPSRLMTPEEWVGGQLEACRDADGLILWGGWGTISFEACRPTYPLGHPKAASQARMRLFLINALYLPLGIPVPEDWAADRPMIERWIDSRVVAYARLTLETILGWQREAHAAAADQRAKAALQPASR